MVMEMMVVEEDSRISGLYDAKQLSPGWKKIAISKTTKSSIALAGTVSD